MNHEIAIALFDYGGVLAEEGFQEGLAAIARLNGIDRVEFVQAGNEVVHETGYVTGQCPEAVYWDALRHETGIVQDDESLRQEILSRFVLRDWMIGFVSALRARRIRPGILSDQTNWLEELDGRDDFFRYFDYIFNSYHMGSSKREEDHFDKVVRVIGVKSGAILFVDDNEGNCARARSRGMRVIHYIDRPQFLAEAALFFPDMGSDVA